MPMIAFAHRLQRLNRSVGLMLADAQVRWGSAESVSGIFYEPSGLSDVGELGMGTTSPVLYLADAHVPAAAVGQQVQINGKPYEVQDTQPDGGGWTKLILEVLHA